MDTAELQYATRMYYFPSSGKDEMGVVFRSEIHGKNWYVHAANALAVAKLVERVTGRPVTLVGRVGQVNFPTYLNSDVVTNRMRARERVDQLTERVQSLLSQAEVTEQSLEHEREVLVQARAVKPVPMSDEILKGVLANYAAQPEVLAVRVAGEYTPYGNRVPNTHIYAVTFMPVVIEEPLVNAHGGTTVTNGIQVAVTTPTTFLVGQDTVSGMPGEIGHPHVLTGTGLLCNGQAHWPYGNLAGMLNMLREFGVGHQIGHAYDRDWRKVAADWWGTNLDTFHGMCAREGKQPIWNRTVGELRQSVEQEPLDLPTLERFIKARDWIPLDPFLNLNPERVTMQRERASCAYCYRAGAYGIQVAGKYWTVCACCAYVHFESTACWHEEGFFGTMPGLAEARVTKLPGALATKYHLRCMIPVCGMVDCEEHPALSPTPASYVLTMPNGTMKPICLNHSVNFQFDAVTIPMPGVYQGSKPKQRIALRR